MSYASHTNPSADLLSLATELALERAAVSDSAVDDVLKAWATATDAYCSCGYVVVGHRLGDTRWLQYRRLPSGGHELVALHPNQLTFTVLDDAAFQSLRESIRAGELEISVYRRFWTHRSQQAPLMKLYLAEGCFHPFDYKFRLPLGNS